MTKKTFTVDPVKLVAGALLAGFGIILIHSGKSVIGSATSGNSKKNGDDAIF